MDEDADESMRDFRIELEEERGKGALNNTLIYIYRPADAYIPIALRITGAVVR